MFWGVSIICFQYSRREIQTCHLVLPIPKNKFFKLIASVVIVYFWLFIFSEFRRWLFTELCLLSGDMNPDDLLCFGYFNQWFGYYILEPFGIISSWTYIWSEKRKEK